MKYYQQQEHFWGIEKSSYIKISLNKFSRTRTELESILSHFILYIIYYIIYLQLILVKLIMLIYYRAYMFNTHMDEIFLQLYCMKWVPGDSQKEILN